MGYGTFRGFTTESIEEHQMDKEKYTISEETYRSIKNALNEKRRVLAVGTTSTRVLETLGDVFLSDQEPEELSGSSQLFIYPPYEFKVISGLFTNFHYPKTTVLTLTSAMVGSRDELIDNIYNEALANEYKWFSYGDGMLVLPEEPTEEIISSASSDPAAEDIDDTTKIQEKEGVKNSQTVEIHVPDKEATVSSGPSASAGPATSSGVNLPAEEESLQAAVVAEGEEVDITSSELTTALMISESIDGKKGVYGGENTINREVEAVIDAAIETALAAPESIKKEESAVEGEGGEGGGGEAGAIEKEAEEGPAITEVQIMGEIGGVGLLHPVPPEESKPSYSSPRKDGAVSESEAVYYK